jgi:hypothetical protein
VEFAEVPGHQQNLLVEPNVSFVAEKLEAALKAAHEKSSLEAGVW